MIDYSLKLFPEQDPKDAQNGQILIIFTTIFDFGQVQLWVAAGPIDLSDLRKNNKKIKLAPITTV